MPTNVPGVHHVTAIASDPAENVRFYTEVLGLRLVKRSVNQDDASVYHLFYGDDRGSPGTSMTFFPYVGASPGRVGTGQVSATHFLVPRDSLEWWVDRLSAAEVDHEAPTDRFDETVVRFTDPDGLHLELVGRENVPAGHPARGPVPEEHAIRGFQGVTLSVQDARSLRGVLDQFGLERRDSHNERTRFLGDGELGSAIDLLELPDGQRGRSGAGTVHHVAYYVETDELDAWRGVLRDAGLRPTEVIDRKWFKSVYARTQAGILFELATPDPGYTVDESLEELGSSLVLPEWMEDRRDEIESALPSLPIDT